ncbi:MAG: hemerythrin domain-containing protein [Gammaproteobacteria bacterium]
MGVSKQQNVWVERMENATSPLDVPMDNPSVMLDSKDRKEILASLLLHFWHGYRRLRDTLMELEEATEEVYIDGSLAKSDGILTDLEMENAMQEGNVQRAQVLFREVKKFAGYHFRYEEEAVLPAIRQLTGEKHMGEFKRAHDQVIRLVQRLEELLSKPCDGRAGFDEAQSTIQELLVHFTATAGLTLLIETLPREQLILILRARERALIEGRDLYEWEENIRD